MVTDVVNRHHSRLVHQDLGDGRESVEARFRKMGFGDPEKGDVEGSGSG